MRYRELDALVAKKVMGWKPYWQDATCWVCPINGVQCDWHPSELIAAAWKVVEKFHNDGVLLTITNEDLQWRIEIGDPFGDSLRCAQEKSLPMAICLAALKAVGVEVND